MTVIEEMVTRDLLVEHDDGYRGARSGTAPVSTPAMTIECSSATGVVAGVGGNAAVATKRQVKRGDEPAEVVDEYASAVIALVEDSSHVAEPTLERIEDALTTPRTWAKGWRM